MFNLFRKKTLPKRTLLLSALPTEKEEFVQKAKDGSSDFIESLGTTFATHDPDTLWDKYSVHAKTIKELAQRIEGMGGTAVTEFRLEHLSLMKDYEIVLILAHHSDVSDEIELHEGLVRSARFIDAIPTECQLYLDITSCYSSHLIPWIKARIPNSKIIGIDIPTSLSTRLSVLNKTLDILSKGKILDYLEIIKLAWQSTKIEKDNIIKLGNKFQSSVYSPKNVRKGEDLVVSIFLHNSQEGDEVEIMSRDIDPDAEKRGSIKLKVRLKKGDYVDFQFLIDKKQYHDFKIDKAKKGFYWDGEIESVEFIVSIPEETTKTSFVGQINMAVNKEKCGEMVFRTLITETTTRGAVPCARIDFQPTDHEKERNYQKKLLIDILSKKAHNIKQTEQKDEVSKSEYEMCLKCIELLQSHPEKRRDEVLKVFISSTSDMIDFRKIMRDRINACEMYADMYENWGQGNDYPRDMCCRHVLESDIFVCILGAKYGFVEPIWNKSMTEIEYRIAANAGIPILIYIYEPYKRQMEALTGVDRENAVRQEKLIEELKHQRLVSIFPDELSLQMVSNSELLILKHKLES